MSLFSQYFDSICEPFSREQILHSFHIFLPLLSAKGVTSWRQTVTLHLAHFFIIESWRNLGTQSIYPFPFPKRRKAFDCPCNVSSTETCTLLIEWWLELKCVATGLSLQSLMSRRCSSIIFLQSPSRLTNIHHFVTLCARESIYDVPLPAHRCRFSLRTTGLTICFAGLSWSRHVSLQFAMNQCICQVAISSVGCNWSFFEYLLHPIWLMQGGNVLAQDLAHDW